MHQPDAPPEVHFQCGDSVSTDDLHGEVIETYEYEDSPGGPIHRVRFYDEGEGDYFMLEKHHGDLVLDPDCDRAQLTRMVTSRCNLVASLGAQFAALGALACARGVAEQLDDIGARLEYVVAQVARVASPEHRVPHLPGR